MYVKLKKLFKKNKVLSTQLVIGIGGGGSIITDYIAAKKNNKITTVVFNTDRKSLSSISHCNIKMFEPGFNGLGLGSKPELAQQAGQEIFLTMIHLCQQYKKINLISCLGGGVGSGYSVLFLDLLTKEIKSSNIRSYLTLPFVWEGEQRTKNAHKSLTEMKKHNTKIYVYENNKLSEQFGKNCEVQSSFNKLNEQIYQKILKG